MVRQEFQKILIEYQRIPFRLTAPRVFYQLSTGIAYKYYIVNAVVVNLPKKLLMDVVLVSN